MRAYELMVIFDAESEESKIAGKLNKITELTQHIGGTVEKVDKWGVRRFAYEMKKRQEGFYAVCEVLSPAALAEVDRTLRIDDDVVRHKIIRLPLHEAHRRGLSGATA